MPRGVSHPPAIRAQAIAAVASGETISETARRFGLPKRTVANWWGDGTVGTDNARAQEALSWLIYGLATDILAAVRTQVQAASREEWLAQQNAGDLAELVGTELDRLVRLLAGFRPAHAALPADTGDGAEAQPADGDQPT